ncbi:hypothetical protein D3C87_2039500 [compost metagenome]
MAQFQPARRFAFVLNRLTAEMNADQPEQTAPEHHHHRKNRPQLNDHFKGFGLIAGKTQPLANDDHVPGRRYRQKFS